MTGGEIGYDDDEPDGTDEEPQLSGPKEGQGQDMRGL
jgi:hypothetical protein